jgi:hypothetical protein
MKKIILIIAILTFSIEGYSQKIETYNVWSELYPSNQNYDNENRLIRKVNRDGANIEFRTKIEKTFYYNVGNLKKALVILYSYRYDEANNENESCHACFPEFEIAYFSLSNGNWVKNKFIQNWKESTGSWGNGAELEIKDYNKVKCLVIKSSYGNQGEFYDYTDYYNIETLKKIKSLKKRI